MSSGLLDSKLILITIACVVAIIGYVLVPAKRPECNLSTVSNRDFARYYGIGHVDNPLAYLNAEHAGSINNKCYLFYDHMHMFSNGDASLSKSIIVLALRGAGKTQMRQCLINRLSQHNRIVLNIFGTTINNYLHNFVTNIDIVSDLPHEKLRKYWKQEHFLQVILAETAAHFINEKYIPILKAKRNTIPFQKRLEMAVLLSFYSTQDSVALCTMVNILIHEFTECSFLDCRIRCTELQFDRNDEEIFSALAEKHRKIKAKRQTPATDACLRVLAAIHKKTGSTLLNLLDSSYRDQVAVLINFLSTLEIGTAFVVDSLDESAFFFNKADSELQALQAFVESVTNDELLHLAVGNWGENTKMENSFVLYIFIPKIPDKPITISWTRPDKIQIIDVNWDGLQLINYADYILDYLRSRSVRPCEPLPDICALLGERELCVKTMKQLRHPRDFHIFFQVFTAHMSSVCTHRIPPYNATAEDLKVILAETKKRVLTE